MLAFSFYYYKGKHKRKLFNGNNEKLKLLFIIETAIYYRLNKLMFSKILGQTILDEIK